MIDRTEAKLLRRLEQNLPILTACQICAVIFVAVFWGPGLWNWENKQNSGFPCCLTGLIFAAALALLLHVQQWYRHIPDREKATVLKWIDPAANAVSAFWWLIMWSIIDTVSISLITISTGGLQKSVFSAYYFALAGAIASVAVNWQSILVPYCIVAIGGLVATWQVCDCNYAGWNPIAYLMVVIVSLFISGMLNYSGLRSFTRTSGRANSSADSTAEHQALEASAEASNA